MKASGDIDAGLKLLVRDLVAVAAEDRGTQRVTVPVGLFDCHVAFRHCCIGNRLLVLIGAHI